MDNLSQTKDLTQKIVSDRKIRTAITRQSHSWFFAVYFGHYIKYPTAPFQNEMFKLTEDANIKNIYVVAFRGSAKSTLMTLSYPIWAILGKQQKKFVVILGQTQSKARQHLVNLKREFETNDLLRTDLGPFEEQDDEWGSYSLVLPKYGARITAASSEQSIRGLRHAQYRPDLIIADDIEDLISVRTKEGRDKIFQWFTGDVIPAGDKDTRIVVVGNLLHEDSLLMRLKKGLEADQLDGIFKSYPLLDEQGRIAWLGKFSSLADIELLKRTIGNEASWQREYLLRIIADEEMIIRPEWIIYYDELPSDEYYPRCRYTKIGVDLAISMRDSADFTAMVPAKVYGHDDKMRIYILPGIVNAKINFPDAIERAKILSRTIGRQHCAELLVENVGYQEAFCQQLRREGFPASSVSVGGQDKRARLTPTSYLIQGGKVLFPRKGAEALIEQLVGFGVEKHDDLADAFALVVNDAMLKNDEGCVLGHNEVNHIKSVMPKFDAFRGFKAP